MRNADLRCANLQGAKWSTVNLEGADLRGANLHGASWGTLNLEGADLRGANLEHAVLSGLRSCPAHAPQSSGWRCVGKRAADGTPFYSLVGPGVWLRMLLDGTDLSGVDLTGADLGGVEANQLSGCPGGIPAPYACVAAPADGTHFLAGPGVTLSGDLSGADLSGRNLVEANVSPALLRNANLAGADLGGVSLEGADLSGVNLAGASLGRAVTGSLIACPAQLPDDSYRCVVNRSGSFAIVGHDVTLRDSLAGADLSHVNFSGADLQNIDLNGANLTGAELGAVRSIVPSLLNQAAAALPMNCPASLPSGVSCVPLHASGDGGTSAVLVLPGRDLGGLDLSNADFDGVDFSGVHLGGVNFTGATMAGAKLDHADTSGLAACPRVLPSAGCRCIDGGRGQFVLTAPGAKLWAAPLGDSDLSGADLSGIGFYAANLVGANLKDADLTGADLGGAYPYDLTACPAKLPDASWECVVEPASGKYLLAGPKANYYNVDLSGIDLSGAHLSGATLTQVNLSNAKLVNTDLSYAITSMVTLTGAVTTGANFEGSGLTIP